MSITLTIPRRFRGPHNSANGGYAAGAVAALVSGPCQVVLRQPPPLDKRLRVEGTKRLKVYCDDLLVMEARPAQLDVVPEPPIRWQQAQRMSQAYVGFRKHLLPECFTCGTTRHDGDGLRIFPGRELAHHAVAAPWVPDATLTNGTDRVGGPILWAALDCPGYWAVAPGELALLGTITAQVRGSVSVGERCVVMGWTLGREGRKCSAGTALYGEDGRLVGLSHQTWVLLR